MRDVRYPNQSRPMFASYLNRDGSVQPFHIIERRDGDRLHTFCGEHHFALAANRIAYDERPLPNQICEHCIAEERINTFEEGHQR